MHLVVHIPYRSDEESARALGLAQRAPSFTIEWVECHRVAVAIFPSLPTGIDAAVQLVGEAIPLSGAWASLNAKPFSNLTRLWQRLSCYRDSLNASDPLRYCRERSDQYNQLVGCDRHHCPVLCQFMCASCLSHEQAESSADSADRFKTAAEQAEVDWCPQLHAMRERHATLLDPQSVQIRSTPSA